ncbi:MAG: MarR family transcriptional regulator [Pseudomonadota bacterium]
MFSIARNAIDTVYRPQLSVPDLTDSQYIALMALAEKDGVSISALARTLGLRKPTLTPRLRRLEEKGLMSRETEGGNERQKNVTLRPAGLETLKGSGYVTEKVFAETGLTSDEAEQPIALGKKLVRAQVGAGSVE